MSKISCLMLSIAAQIFSLAQPALSHAEDLSGDRQHETKQVVHITTPDAGEFDIPITSLGDTNVNPQQTSYGNFSFVSRLPANSDQLPKLLFPASVYRIQLPDIMRHGKVMPLPKTQILNNQCCSGSAVITNSALGVINHYTEQLVIDELPLVYNYYSGHVGALETPKSITFFVRCLRGNPLCGGTVAIGEDGFRYRVQFSSNDTQRILEIVSEASSTLENWQSKE